MKPRYVKFRAPGIILVVDERMDTTGCEKIDVADVDWQDAGSPSWWVDDEGTIRKPTQAEKDQRVIDKEAAIIKNKQDNLFQFCEDYEILNVDRNMQSEFDLSRALYEAGKAEPEQLPLAKSLGDWKESLWADYYTRKAAITVDSILDSDFSNHNPVPTDFQGLRSERETFLAAQ